MYQGKSRRYDDNYQYVYDQVIRSSDGKVKQEFNQLYWDILFWCIHKITQNYPSKSILQVNQLVVSSWPHVELWLSIIWLVRKQIHYWRQKLQWNGLDLSYLSRLSCRISVVYSQLIQTLKNNNDVIMDPFSASKSALEMY